MTLRFTNNNILYSNLSVLTLNNFELFKNGMPNDILSTLFSKLKLLNHECDNDVEKKMKVMRKIIPFF